MKPIQMFILESCPYCRQALRWMDELTKENPKYSDVKLDIIDEGVHPEIANEYDYYYVPTYYVNGIKVHEGVANKEIVRKMYETALE